MDRFAKVPVTAAGAGLGARAFRVLIAIAAHADGQGQAFPSITRIAQMAGIDRRGLHREIAALQAAGLLSVQHRDDPAGDRTSNLYTIIFSSGVSSPEATPIVSSDDTVSALRTRRGVVSGDDLTDQYGTDQRTHMRLAARQRVPVVHDGASEFNTFWRAYPPRGPHSNPKKPAQQAFEAAVRRGIDPAVIIRGAANYRATIEREGAEARYIAQAVTWLRQERWADHQETPEPPRLRVSGI